MKNSPLFFSWKKNLWLHGLAAVLFFGGLFFLYSQIQKEGGPEATEAEAYSRLQKDNENFQRAEIFEKSAKYREAREELRKALKEENSHELRAGLIDLRIGFLFAYEKKLEEAILHLKQVAATERYSPEVRAYAVWKVGNLYYEQGGERTVEPTFATEPYKSLYTSDDLALSYRRLFEYASHFQSIGLSEVRIADYYVNALSRIYNDPAKNSEAENYKNIIRERLANVNNDLVYLEATPHLRSHIPDVLIRKGVIQNKFYRMGERAFGDPEPTLRSALSLFALRSPVQGSYAYYHYAVFLAENHPERISEIRSLLDTFKDSDFEGSNIYRFFQSEKENRLGQKKELVLLARIAPDFKKILLNLGWQEQDFQEEKTGM